VEIQNVRQKTITVGRGLEVERYFCGGSSAISSCGECLFVEGVGFGRIKRGEAEFLPGGGGGEIPYKKGNTTGIL